MIKPPIVLTGSIAIDRLMSFRGRYTDYIHPERFDALSVSIFLDQLTDTYGGVAANIAYSMALLGETPYLLGSIGKDALVYMESLAHLGVNITHLHESSLPTATFNVITDRDQKQIGGFYPGAMFDSASLSLAPWKDQAPLVVISPHDPKGMERQAKECLQWRLPYCYDIGQQVSNLPGEQMRRGILGAQLLIVNDYELTVLSDKSRLSIERIKRQVPIVITTLGQHGSRIEGRAVPEAITVGTAAPKQVVDPTGAGDAYRAGFFFGYLRRWPLRASAQLGAVCATYAIEAIGTQNHRFSLSTVAKRYKVSFNELMPAIE
ncbi:MAG TPA: carbohydrate kinase family protein [Candidatus Saccharimonadales bacterium]|nr:carbohydrate kinase family protein [Candidatus Saccharimonadales bacterium]